MLYSRKVISQDIGEKHTVRASAIEDDLGTILGSYKKYEHRYQLDLIPKECETSAAGKNFSIHPGREDSNKYSSLIEI